MINCTEFLNFHKIQFYQFPFVGYRNLLPLLPQGLFHAIYPSIISRCAQLTHNRPSNHPVPVIQSCMFHLESGFRVPCFEFRVTSFLQHNY